MRERRAREVAVALRPAALVELVEFAIETEQRPEPGRVEEIDDRPQLVDPVLDRRAGQHECVAAVQPLYRLRGLGAPVLDALRFIENDDVGSQPRIYVQSVADHLLVVDDGEERGPLVRGEPHAPSAINDLQVEVGEPANLLFPLGLERGRRDDERADRAADPPQKCARCDRLDRLAEAHLIGEERALREGEVEHALALVGEERHLHLLRGPFAALHLLLVLASQLDPFAFAAARLEPGDDLLRHAHCSGEFPRDRLEGLFRGEIDTAVGAEQTTQTGGRPIGIALDPQSSRLAVRHHVDSRRAGAQRGPPVARMDRLEVRQDRFDVLACAEAVDAEIDAAAGELPRRDIADLHRVVEPASRMDAEGRENRMRPIDAFDARRFLPRPQPAPGALVVVGRPPVAGGGKSGIGPGRRAFLYGRVDSGHGEASHRFGGAGTGQD